MSNAFVRKLASCTVLDRSDERLLADATATTKAVLAHHDLSKDGSKPGPAFVVLEGWALRYKVLCDGSRQVLAFILPGDFYYPHLGRLEKMDHSFATITTCLVASIPRDRMESLIVATPALTYGFRRAELIDQGVSRAWITMLGRRNAAERVAYLMLELFMRMRNVGLTAGKTCRLPLTHAIIADALGLTAVHVSRMLSRLRKQRIMELSSGTLTIIDMRALESLASLDRGFQTSSSMVEAAVEAPGLSA